MNAETRQRLLKGSPSGAMPAGDRNAPPAKNLLEESEEDVILNISLRPKKLPDFIGQKDIVDNLKICLTAAKQRKESLEHILLSGPPA